MAKLYKKRQEREIIEFAKFSNDLAKFETTTFKMDIFYPRFDSRMWTALLNQGSDNVIVTYHINKEYHGHQSFDIISSKGVYTDIDPDYIFDTLDSILTSNKSSYNYNND